MTSLTGIAIVFYWHFKSIAQVWCQSVIAAYMECTVRGRTSPENTQHERFCALQELAVVYSWLDPPHNPGPPTATSHGTSHFSHKAINSSNFPTMVSDIVYSKAATGSVSLSYLVENDSRYPHSLITKRVCVCVFFSLRRLMQSNFRAECKWPSLFTAAITVRCKDSGGNEQQSRLPQGLEWFNLWHWVKYRRLLGIISFYFS